MFERFLKKKQTEAEPRPKFVMPDFDEQKIIIEIQPIIRPSDGAVVGAEALSRYLGEGDRMIEPLLFVPILESASVISELDAAVVRRMIAQMKKWREQGKKMFPMSFNFSRADFSEKGFLENMDALLQENGIEKELVTIEVRESAVADSYEFMQKRLTWLHEQGYRIAIDDFGREDNLIFFFGDLPIDIVKFDRAVLMDAMHTEKGGRIMRHLIAGLKEAGMTVICEGVEDREQEQIVMDAGCEQIQGFLYDKPLGIWEFGQKYL
ncbi:MAG: EAL domain-containing protein [Lachnospiraceae bacterium]|nr:EAL domain-containing protein [Lachnospiraceae bacterium]